MRKQKAGKKRLSRKKKILLIVLAVILALLFAAAAAVYLVGHGFYHASNYTPDEDAMEGYIVGEEEEDEVDPDSDSALTEEEQKALEEELAGIQSAETISSDKNVYNVLLIGVDRRDKSWAGNSDTMILMSVNYDKKQISMVSLMRDTYVDIPGIGMRKLNAAHANGAGPLLIKTVTQNFKIQVDRYASVDFESMMEIVDKLGGVSLTLSEKEVEVVNNGVRSICSSKNLDPEEYLLPGAGTWNCSGMAAVSYARIRSIGHADFQRTERQRAVLTQIIEKAKDMSLTELYAFAQDVLPLVTHNIPEREMWALIAKAPSLFQYDLVKARVPYDNLYSSAYVKKQSVLIPDWKPTLEKLKELLY